MSLAIIEALKEEGGLHITYIACVSQYRESTDNGNSHQPTSKLLMRNLVSTHFTERKGLVTLQTSSCHQGTQLSNTDNKMLTSAKHIVT